MATCPPPPRSRIISKGKKAISTTSPETPTIESSTIESTNLEPTTTTTTCLERNDSSWETANLPNDVVPISYDGIQDTSYPVAQEEQPFSPLIENTSITIISSPSESPDNAISTRTQSRLYPDISSLSLYAIGTESKVDSPADSNTITSATTSHLLERLRDFVTPKQLREINHEANLYAILRTTEQLVIHLHACNGEKAYASGCVLDDIYEKNSYTLINQFKSAKIAVQAKSSNMEEFIQKNELYCPLAEERLLRSLVPATCLNEPKDQAKQSESLMAFELSGHFITLLDALKLNERSVDAVLPLVQEVVVSLGRIKPLPSEQMATGIGKMNQWLVLLNSMEAYVMLTVEQSRQLCLDGELAYSNVRHWLQSNNT